MKTSSSLSQYQKPSGGCVVTVGNFDGVHLGHQAIIAGAQAIANEKRLPLVGMTFEPSPLAVLFPKRAPRVLTPLPIKRRLLESRGLDQLVVLESTGELLAMTAEEFVRDILVERIGVQYMVEGQTFNFGRQRQGNIMSLAELGERYGFSVERVASKTLFLEDAEEGNASKSDDRSGKTMHHSPIAVSSTLIRELVTSGQFLAARQCLGRWFGVYGTVEHGQGLGKKIGYPTVNLKCVHENQLVPGDGVFAGWVRFGEEADALWQNTTYLPAAISIGQCETFAIGQRQIEAHILDYEAEHPDLYGRHVLFEPVERVRPQRKFDSAELLQQAIEADCRVIRSILSRIHPS